LHLVGNISKGNDIDLTSAPHTCILQGNLIHWETQQGNTFVHLQWSNQREYNDVIQQIRKLCQEDITNFKVFLTTYTYHTHSTLNGYLTINIWKCYLLFE